MHLHAGVDAAFEDLHGLVEVGDVAADRVEVVDDDGDIAGSNDGGGEGEGEEGEEGEDDFEEHFGCELDWFGTGLVE